MKKNQGHRAVSGLNSVFGGQLGLTLLEVLVALGILAAVAAVFLLGLTTSSKATIVSQKHVVAESLAKSQMEYIKSQPYDDDLNHNQPQYLKLADEDIPAGYDITITAERLNPEEDDPNDDDGLQEITVTVTRSAEEVLTVTGYKVK